MFLVSNVPQTPYPPHRRSPGAIVAFQLSSTHTTERPTDTKPSQVRPNWGFGWNIVCIVYRNLLFQQYRGWFRRRKMLIVDGVLRI